MYARHLVKPSAEDVELHTPMTSISAHPNANCVVSATSRQEENASNDFRSHTSFDAVEENEPEHKEAFQEALRLMTVQTRHAVPARGGIAVPDHYPGAAVVLRTPPNVTPKVVRKGDLPPRSVSSPGVAPDPGPRPKAASCVNSRRPPTTVAAPPGPIVCVEDRYR
ncbi:hypothetical protein MTO96_016907 [Rhipicephalus appendiculatus]